MLITSLIFIETYWCWAQNNRIDSRNPTEEEFLQFHLTSSHNYSKWWKFTHFWLFILYITVQNENIIPTNMCYDKINVFIQNLQEIDVSTLSKM